LAGTGSPLWAPPEGEITPTTAEERTKNELRPERLSQVVGQAGAKELMRDAIESCYDRERPLDHTLIVAASGLGKSTLSHVVANELGVDVYEVEAPVSFDTLLELRTQMRPGAILKIEEIHQQGIMERRGRSGATQPEVLYAVMEDRMIPTPTGILAFPWITVMGTTTDEGLLPDAFINRFPLRPRLVPYTLDELGTIVAGNARTLGLDITDEAIDVFAKASRGVPRQINNYVKNALVVTRVNEVCDRERALRVLSHNGVTEDGLTADMQNMLTFLLTRARRRNAAGEVTYQASVNTIATAIGKSRDSKAVALRVEPFLIELGYVQVGHGGRTLTDRGIARAQTLVPV
jgi:holliday junction DNA helicase RuvB